MEANACVICPCRHAGRAAAATAPATTADDIVGRMHKPIPEAGGPVYVRALRRWRGAQRDVPPQGAREGFRVSSVWRATRRDTCADCHAAGANLRRNYAGRVQSSLPSAGHHAGSGGVPRSQPLAQGGPGVRFALCRVSRAIRVTVVSTAITVRGARRSPPVTHLRGHGQALMPTMGEAGGAGVPPGLKTPRRVPPHV